MTKEEIELLRRATDALETIALAAMFSVTVAGRRPVHADPHLIGEHLEGKVRELLLRCEGEGEGEGDGE